MKKLFGIRSRTPAWPEGTAHVLLPCLFIAPDPAQAQSHKAAQNDINPFHYLQEPEGKKSL